MFQVRIHGRGGQGVVTAAELLSVAAFYEDAHSQAFPMFGSERTGAPVVAQKRGSSGRHSVIRPGRPASAGAGVVGEASVLTATPPRRRRGGR